MMDTGYPDELYTALTSEIESFARMDLTKERETEKCFGASIQHDRKLHAWLHNFHFANEAEEIYFFRRVKPKFTASIHYYTKLYQSLMLVPPDVIEHVIYYTNELSKIEKFFADNGDFYGYYTSGATNRDREYFTRTSREKSAMDMLLGEILGFERYREYLQGKIDEGRKPI